MTTYLLDTNHISPLVTPGHPLQAIFSQQREDGNTFCIAVPALTEMLFGIRSLPRAQKNLYNWQAIEDFFVYYSIEKSDAEYAAELQLLLRRQGWQLRTVDALIASIALRYDLILLTTDKDFRAIPHLLQENWLSPA